MAWEEEPLDLGLPAPALDVRVEGEKAKKKPKPKVRWSSYKPRNPVHCDRCLAIAHGVWPKQGCIPFRATMKRTLGEDVTYWCAEHGELAKRNDGYSRGR